MEVLLEVPLEVHLEVPLPTHERSPQPTKRSPEKGLPHPTKKSLPRLAYLYGEALQGGHFGDRPRQTQHGHVGLGVDDQLPETLQGGQASHLAGE